MYRNPRVSRDPGTINPAELNKQVLQRATSYRPPQPAAAVPNEPPPAVSPAYTEVSQAIQRVRSTLLPTMLTLNYYDLANEDAELIAQVLNEQNVGLTYLSLACNNIKSQGLAALAYKLNTNKTLQVLHLQNNQIDDAGMLALGTALKTNTTLKEVWLSDNRITSKGLTTLCEALVVNKTLTNIRLDKNPIDNEGAKVLAAILKVKNSTVQQLDLRFSDASEPAVLNVIQQVTATNFARPRMAAFLCGSKARPNNPVRSPVNNFFRSPIFERATVRLIFQFSGLRS